MPNHGQLDNLIARQANIINAAIHSQTAINDANLRKRYANYPRAPKLRQRLETEVDDHSGTTEPLPVSFTVVSPKTPRPPIFAATKWIQVKNPFSEEWDYIKQIQSERLRLTAVPTHENRRWKPAQIRFMVARSIPSLTGATTPRQGYNGSTTL